MTDAERIAELEDALIDEMAQGLPHTYANCKCPGQVPDPRTREPDPWSRDPECPACQRLERLIGHRRPEPKP